MRTTDRGALLASAPARLRRCTAMLCLAFATAAAAGGGGVKKRPDLTGTCRGTIDIAGMPRRITLQLHQRASGELIGLVLGGTSFRTVTGGGVSGSSVALGLELHDPWLTRTFSLAGTLRGRTFTAVTDDGLGAGAQTVVLTRTAALLHERRFVFFSPDMSAPPMELAVVQDDRGDLVSGGFVSTEGCQPFGCGGGVTSFAEDPATGVVTVGFETAGTCGVTGTFTAPLDLRNHGTYSFTNCRGETSAGTIVGLRGMATRTDHAASVLAAYGRLADDLEARATFAAPHPSFSPGYLHYGETLADRLAELNAQVSRHDALRVELNRFRSLATVVPPGVSPFVATQIGVLFHERRTGVTGGVETELRDAATDPFHDELSVLREEAGSWVIAGNQDPQPFGLELPVDPAQLAHPIQSYGIWPFGVHGGGHPRGHPGLDFELVEGANVLAMRSGVVAAVEDGGFLPGHKTVVIDHGGLQIGYDHIDAATLPGSIAVGTAVAAGDVIGHPGLACCEDAACGYDGCCAERFPNEVCGTGFRMIHLGVRWALGPFCPYDLTRRDLQEKLEASFRGAAYGEELTEPFLCNTLGRNVFPLVTAWTRTGPAVSPGAPAVVRISRPSPLNDTADTYEWVDFAGSVTSTGSIVRHGGGAIDFVEAPPSSLTYRARFDVEGAATTATLRLDVGTTSGSWPADLTRADTYSPTIVR